jgi:putative ABC transport system permease protein
MIRTAVDPLSLVSTIRSELRAIDPTVAIENIRTMDQIRADSIATQTFALRLLAGFSLTGSVLALVGIYGVLSLSVGSRQREIAIRMAIGAQQRNIVGLVLSEGLALLALGLLVGSGIAVILGRALRAFLFGVEPTDPITFVAVPVAFTVVALLACCLPARRAAKIEPMTALRSE